MSFTYREAAINALCLVSAVFLVLSHHAIKHYERAFIFRSGRFVRMGFPPTCWIIPFLEKVQFVDLRRCITNYSRLSEEEIIRRIAPDYVPRLHVLLQHEQAYLPTPENAWGAALSFAGALIKTTALAGFVFMFIGLSNGLDEPYFLWFSASALFVCFASFYTITRSEFQVALRRKDGSGLVGLTFSRRSPWRSKTLYTGSLPEGAGAELQPSRLGSQVVVITAPDGGRIPTFAYDLPVVAADRVKQVQAFLAAPDEDYCAFVGKQGLGPARLMLALAAYFFLMGVLHVFS